MAASVNAYAAEPLGEINTTPLIDVLLVLLVMLILTVPIATNTLTVDLPRGVVEPSVVVDPIRNRLVVTQDNRLTWNGTAITRAELPALLARVTAMRPEPEVQFEPEAAASYDLSAQVLNQVQRARLTHFGFSGMERYRQFDKAD